jgi:hypothetical protein
MLKGSLCANPELSAYVTLFPFGLSNKNDTCFVIAGDGNLGDGFTKCGVQTEKQALATFDKGYLVRGRMLVHRLDDMVQEPVHVSTASSAAAAAEAVPMLLSWPRY